MRERLLHPRRNRPKLPIVPGRLLHADSSETVQCSGRVRRAHPGLMNEAARGPNPAGAAVGRAESADPAAVARTADSVAAAVRGTCPAAAAGRAGAARGPDSAAAAAPGGHVRRRPGGHARRRRPNSEPGDHARGRRRLVSHEERPGQPRRRHPRPTGLNLDPYNAPGFACAKTPSSPVTARSTSVVSGRTVNTTSAPSTASAIEDAPRPPRATWVSTFPGLRLNPTTTDPPRSGAVSKSARRHSGRTALLRVPGHRCSNSSTSLLHLLTRTRHPPTPRPGRVLHVVGRPGGNA